MLSRPLKLALAGCAVIGLFAAVVATNSRLSWLPVVVEFVPQVASISPPQPPLPIAWVGDELWLLKEDKNYRVARTPPLRIARNWNHATIPIVPAAYGVFDDDVMAVQSADEFAHTSPNLRIAQGKRFLGLETSGAHSILAFSPDGKFFVADSREGGTFQRRKAGDDYCGYGLTLFEAQSGRRIRRQSAVAGCFADFAWSPDSREVAGITVAGKSVAAPMPLETGAVELAFSPDGMQLAVGEHGFVLILDGTSLATERRLILSSPTAKLDPICLAWSPDSATLTTATQDRLTFWRMR